VLTPFRELLEERRSAQAAAGAFTCYDATTALGVVRAAAERRAPVVLLVSDASFRAREGRLHVASLLGIAREAPVPVCVQLDHASEPAVLRDAIAAGVGAVMADGSRLPAVENADLVRRVLAAAGGAGVGVEAELGHIEGGEDVAAATAAGALTDPDEAAAFVGAMRVDCLAVSIGNVHGTYAAPPALDWSRLERIRAAVDGTPLSLHGASGLPDDDVRRAIALGVCKVNVNTEVRGRYLDELERRLPAAKPGSRLLELDAALIDAVAEVAGRKLDLLAGATAGR
jgi:tagatose 1,6-diphosphate aldolase GatY/KbaY